MLGRLWNTGGLSLSAEMLVKKRLERRAAYPHRTERGDIWYVRLSDPDTGRAARRTEVGAKKDQPIRPCVVVSSNFFNEAADRITVVPLNVYSEGKEDTMARWAATISGGRGYHPITGKLQEPGVCQTCGREWHGEGADLDEPPREVRYQWKKSIVDAAQLWTVFCAPKDSKERIERPDGSSPTLGDLNDVQWDQNTALLTPSGLIDVESALQVLISACVRLTTPSSADKYDSPRSNLFKFQEGDLLRMDLPGRPQQGCLVVSSSSVDYLRAHIQRRGVHFGQVTVVPLLSREEVQRLAPGPSCPPTLIPVGNTVALCQELYTIDWRARPHQGDGLPQRALFTDLNNVRNGIRSYLGLPGCQLEG
ncbi:MAG: type II toxin-antitoxin system PemK/MazF family toxin [Candidatus Binatia bacterium]